MMEKARVLQDAIKCSLTGDVSVVLSKNCNDFSRCRVFKLSGGAYFDNLSALFIGESTRFFFFTAFAPISQICFPSRIRAWMNTQSITERSYTGSFFNAIVNRFAYGGVCQERSHLNYATL
ncbi:hypothetical protein AU468_06275 [Alkalispirochaeta sphaeroplastigenens]|uniref:Uncharacterized protein n=1 Tax=Alkalispirochaeta sphaeroplastigenens TaxID=1187066 RepID=A0A2S4JSH7_9SPIO|nr:hypothetical protein AU468_06275 [Alkalispirochaeta sphaeroplastigenens]